VSQALPSFSIIIPTHGRPRQLRRCLESIALLDYPADRLEAIVVDDGSPTPLDSETASCGDQVAVRLVQQEHAGPSTARNTGAGISRGKYLAFTDDDCTPSVDWLQALAARFRATPNCGIGGRTVNLLAENPYSAASQLLVTYLYAYYNTTPDEAQFFASNNLAVPADLFRSVGGFDTSFIRTAGEDRDLCDRWRHRGHRLVYAPEAIVYHAHELTFHTFWRQHFRYGRGAYQFHASRAQRGGGRFWIEPPRFYAGILRYPFSQPRGLAAKLTLMGLMIASQAANAAGFAWEWARAFVTS
jgi:GT2 family glycosyltransferase